MPSVPMPIRLDTVDVASSPIAGRVAFVVDLTGRGSDEVVAALRTLPGVAVPDGPSDLFDSGLNAVFGNYFSAVHVGGGVAALAAGQPFLLAVRALADDVYGSALHRLGAEVVVDGSPSLAETPQAVTALYPDAVIILLDDGGDERSPLVALLGSRVCRVSQADVAGDQSTLAARLAAALDEARTAARAAPRPTDIAYRDERAPREGRLIFVVGCPRSGTTWLEALLTSHPALGGPGRETAIFGSLRPLWNNHARPPAEGLAGWIDRDALIAAIRRFCDTLFRACLGAQEGTATWFLEKTPLHGAHLNLIAAVYPDAWVISIHRDGRDVLRSVLEVSFGLDDLDVAAKEWARLTELIEQTGQSCPRFRDVRYERLLEDPIGQGMELLSWVGLAPTSDVETEMKARAGERVSRYNTAGDVGAGKWRGLSAADLRKIYRHAGDRLVAMGYVTAGELAAVRSRPSYRLDTLKLRLRRGS